MFSFPAYLICFLLLFPFLFFCFRLNSLSWPFEEKFFSVFFMTVFQASTSALLSLFLAVPASCGLLAFSRKKYYFLIEGLALVPCLIPPLLLVLSLVQIVEAFTGFPFGLPALIVSQTLTYTGLCSVALARSLLKEAPSLSEWAYLHGSSPGRFLKMLLKSVLKKDLKILFALVFSACWTGLSLPLLISGSSAFSLEFFIYEHLKDPLLWPKALSLILFQSVFVFLICLWAFSGSASSGFKRSCKKVYLLAISPLALIPFTAVFLSVGGLFFISDMQSVFKLLPLGSFIFSAGLNSFILSLGAGALTLLFLTGMALSFQNRRIRKFMASFMPPGVSFMGFALLVLPFYSQTAVLLKWALGLSLLLFPWIYRWRGERALERLSSQVEQARFMGAGWGLIFYKIIWPNSRSVFFLCAGLVSFWACGDFAYSLIVSSGHWNLSLLVYDFFSSYRLDEAVLLSWIWMILSFLVLIFWLGLGFIFDRKL